MNKKSYLPKMILPILCLCLLLGAAPSALAAPETEPDPAASAATESEPNSEVAAATDPADNTPVDTVADRLVIQLGPKWAGVEFQLQTDYGLYPGTVVVDESGFLKMDLGGSKTYTLSCLNSSVPIPVPDPAATESPYVTEAPDDEGVQSESSAEEDTNSSDEAAGGESTSNIPPMHLILFVGGMAICIGALIAMRIMRKRREAFDQDDEE